MSRNGRVLVVDDEWSSREFLETLLRRQGYEVSSVVDLTEALLCLETDEIDLVVADMEVPGAGGSGILEKASRISPETLFVAISGSATAETAISAVQQGGVCDYVAKPFKAEEVRLVVEKALEKKALAFENQRPKTELRSQKRPRSLIGASASIRSVFELIEQVAPTRTNILISGESGTGKELVARAVHDGGDRAGGPFVALNCGAIPENLLESELFGHVKGAFTGAIREKKGLFEMAEGGTLFLDEVAELPLALQVKLLRVIQDRVVRPIGGNKGKVVDVRMISATNRSLGEDVETGRFRKDLYYRLNVVEIELPPLRERLDDVPLLLRHFMRKFSRENDRGIDSVTDSAMQKLMQYDYPGNVRELENLTERALALARNDSVDLDSLPEAVRGEAPRSRSFSIPPEGVKLDRLLDDYERSLLEAALVKTGGVKKHAATLLGISFRSFRYRLQKLKREPEKAL